MAEEYREPMTAPIPISVDVDDYIFKTQQEWLISDR